MDRAAPGRPASRDSAVLNAPVGNDQQIERTMPAALLVDRDRPCSFACDVEDFYAGDQTGSRRQQTAMQQVE